MQTKPKNTMQRLKSSVKSLFKSGRHSAANGAKSRKKGGRKRVVAIGVAAAVVVAAVGLPMLLGGSGNSAQLDLNDTTVLAYTDMERSISATGTVESAQSTMVYSTNSYTVMGVYAEVGDYVEEGELLAELDDQSIQDQISSQEASISASQWSGSTQIQSAQDNYDNYLYGIENGLNSSLNSAQSQVDSAYASYESAMLTYERYLESLDVGENTTVINAESALHTAESNLKSAADALEAAEESYSAAYDSYRTAKTAVDDAEDELERLNAQKNELEAQISQLESQQNVVQTPTPTTETSPEVDPGVAGQTSGSGSGGDLASLQAQLAEVERQISELNTELSQLEAALTQAETALSTAETQLTSAESSYDNAEYSYETQLATYNATMTSVDNTLADYATNVESAWRSYQEALTNLDTTEKQVQDQLQTYQNNLSSAYANANTATAEESLRQLRVELEGTQITAPCDGTVTAVYAEVGASGSGLLFVIEDVDDLVVETSVQGYDMGTVITGMEVVIRSDATGDEEISGVVSSIAPTSNKTSSGVTDTSSDAVFAAEVEITGKNSGLYIGMDAQLDYIVERADSVLAVPYDAVYENAAGESCVLVATGQSDGRYLIEELPVTTGMDDDLDIAVSGVGVDEGLRVINDPDAYMQLLGETVTAGVGVNTQSSRGFFG